jgi:Domain of unknown function (DUF4288)
MGWYGVRMMFITRLVGQPRRPDAGYRAGLAIQEDRVVIVQARSGASALRKAEREASRYSAGVRTTNSYGQRVVTKPMGVATAYEMDGEPIDGAEVYAATRFVSAHASKRALLRGWREFESDEVAFTRRFAWMFIAGFLKSGFDEWSAKRRGGGAKKSGRARR